MSAEPGSSDYHEVVNRVDSDPAEGWDLLWWGAFDGDPNVRTEFRWAARLVYWISRLWRRTVR